jgi:hypothetical protein
MEVDSTTQPQDESSRNTALNQDSRNSAEGKEYFQTSPDGTKTRVTVSTNDRAPDATNGNRAELHNNQFPANQPNDFEAWVTVHEGHSFSVAQLLNFGTDGASPDVMFTVEQGAAGQPNTLWVRGRSIPEPFEIGPIPADGRFKIEMKYDGANGFTAQVYTGASEETKVPFGPPISGTLSGGGPLQFRTGIYYHGFNDTSSYPEGMEPITSTVDLDGASTAFQTTAEQPAQDAGIYESGSSL